MSLRPLFQRPRHYRAYEKPRDKHVGVPERFLCGRYEGIRLRSCLAAFSRGSIPQTWLHWGLRGLSQGAILMDTVPELSRCLLYGLYSKDLSKQNAESPRVTLRREVLQCCAGRGIRECHYRMEHDRRQWFSICTAKQTTIHPTSR